MLERHPQGRASIGIPTWFHGHEPPNVFATHIAKYFANSIREDMLLTACTGGLVVLPGAAGTVQEIFPGRVRELLRHRCGADANDPGRSTALDP